MQYHYLKRPYELVPLTAEEIPAPSTSTRTETSSKAIPLPTRYGRRSTRSASGRGSSTRSIPVSQRTGTDGSLYHDLTEGRLGEIQDIDDFPETGTRELTAEDYVYQIKRLAHPKLECPLFSTMTKYILGLDELAQELQGELNRIRTERRKGEGDPVQPGERRAGEPDPARPRRLPAGRGACRGPLHVRDHPQAEIPSVRLLAGHALLCTLAARGGPILRTGAPHRPKPEARQPSGRNRALQAGNVSPEQRDRPCSKRELPRGNLSGRGRARRSGPGAPGRRRQATPLYREGDLQAGKGSDPPVEQVPPGLLRHLRHHQRGLRPGRPDIHRRRHRALGLDEGARHPAPADRHDLDVLFRLQHARRRGGRLHAGETEAAQGDLDRRGHGGMDSDLRQRPRDPGPGHPAARDLRSPARQGGRERIRIRVGRRRGKTGEAIDRTGEATPGRGRIPGRKGQGGEPPGGQLRHELDRGLGKAANRLAQEAVQEARHRPPDSSDRLQPLPGQGQEGELPDPLLGVERGLPGSGKLPVPPVRTERQGEARRGERRKLREPRLRPPFPADGVDAERSGASAGSSTRCSRSPGGTHR